MRWPCKAYVYEILLLAIVYLFTGSDTILWNIPRWKNLMTIMEASKLISIGLNCGPQNISTLQI